MRGEETLVGRSASRAAVAVAEVHPYAPEGTPLCFLYLSWNPIPPFCSTPFEE
jgi:hypothetical protein